MKKDEFLQLLAVLVLVAFFALTFGGYFMKPNDIVTKGADVFGAAFDKIVEFFTTTE